MCLIKTHRFPKISRKPIIVYKEFIEFNGQLITPCMCLHCQCGSVIKASDHWFKGIFKNIIEGEGVHAYTNDYWKLKISDNNKYYYICEIPPYTPYWIGAYDEIAASKMKIIKKLNS